jgi:hypothetical protein
MLVISWQDMAQRRHISAQAIMRASSFIISHISAHFMHTVAHMPHIWGAIIEPRIMQLAHVWHISAQSMSIRIISALFCIMFCCMQYIIVSMHIAWQFMQFCIQFCMSVLVPIDIIGQFLSKYEHP